MRDAFDPRVLGKVWRAEERSLPAPEKAGPLTFILRNEWQNSERVTGSGKTSRARVRRGATIGLERKGSARLGPAKTPQKTVEGPVAWTIGWLAGSQEVG